MALELIAGAVPGFSSLWEDLMGKLKTTTFDQIRHLFTDVEEKLKNLNGSYVLTQSKLDEVDEWEMVTSNPHRQWVGDAYRACYDMEDLAVDVVFEVENAGNSLPCLRTWSLSRRIDELKSNLEQVLAAASTFASVEIRSSGSGSAATASTYVTPKVLLRRQDIEAIVKILLGSTSSSTIIPIQGMFGIGKSVVAQAVKDDARIQNHFDQVFWVPVSGDFNLGNVIRSVVKQPTTEMEQNEVLRTFKIFCTGKKVLIVLDGMSNLTRLQDWENFISLLERTSMLGVLITTRNPSIANKVSSHKSILSVPYQLRLLPNDVALQLIINRVVNPKAHNAFKRKRCLEKNAHKVAEICKGLPLLTDILSARLALTFDEDTSSGDLWEMPEFQNQIFPVFRSVYTDLPKAVKKCFHYLSLFPKDYKFKKHDLLQLWMAEGFIAPKVAGQPTHSCLEQTFYEYFGELSSRSILEIYLPFEEEQQVYIMHEILHRYAQYVGSDIYLRLDKNFIDGHSHDRIVAALCRKARHISLLHGGITTEILNHFSKALRTFISLHQGAEIPPLSYKLFLNLPCLRVLSLSRTNIDKLPESIGKLEHLQLLDVSETNVADLPAATTQLHRLTVLKLTQCPFLLRLPQDTKNLTNLLHLELDVAASFCSMPPKIGKLKNLQTLPVFIVGKEDGFLISELKDMKHLKGSICLKDLENVAAYTEAREAMLCNKPSLRKLELEWNGSSRDQSIAEEVMKGLEPHENLEELQVMGFDGARFPSWLSNPESGLESIYLQRCRICSVLPPLGQLRWLRDLHIEGMRCIKHVDGQFSAGEGTATGFPSLMSLKFKGMDNFERWDGLQATQMPRLRELAIMECPNLIALPSLSQLTSLKSLEICNCPSMQSLPDEDLPSSLEQLNIVGSDLVQRRCEPEVGADWHKIRTVPEVMIDFVQIRTSGTC